MEGGKEKPNGSSPMLGRRVKIKRYKRGASLTMLFFYLHCGTHRTGTVEKVLDWDLVDEGSALDFATD